MLRTPSTPELESNDTSGKSGICMASLLAIILTGVALRLFLFTAPGFQARNKSGDFYLNARWMSSVVTQGIAETYSKRSGVPNHGPVEMILLDIFGHLYQARYPLPFKYLSLSLPFLKAHSIISDIGIGLLLYWFFSHLGNKWYGVIAAAVYTFNPVTLLDGPMWGETDGIYVFFLLATILCISYKNWYGAGFMPIMAYLAKPLAAPIFTLLLVLFFICSNKARLQMLIGACLSLVMSLCLFFGENTVSMLHYISRAPKTAIFNSALNIFWFFGAKEHLIGMCTLREITFVVFCILAFAFLYKSRKKMRNPVALMIIAAILCYGFFLLMWGMHQRHNFPFIVLGMPLLFISLEGIILYILCNICILYNILFFSRITLLHPFLPSRLSMGVFDIFSITLFLWLLWFVSRIETDQQLLKHMKEVRKRSGQTPVQLSQ